MNEIIREELQKVNLQINQVDENTFIIPKQEPPKELVFEIGHYYLIELAEYIIHPYEGYTLHINWNHNIIPSSKYMKCEVIKKMGKMIQINGCGYNPYEDKDGSDMYYDFWLPIGGTKILKEIFI